MESAIFGLIGVVVGGLLGIAKDWWFQKQSRIKAAEYLSIQVACALEQYAFACTDVVNDNGLCDGQPDRNGRHRKVTPPVFDPKSFDVEWKSLPAGLMYEILEFPYKAKVADQQVDAVFEYGNGPPDFSDGFEERQWQYASLGITAWELAEKLRKHINLSTRGIDDWNPATFMKERKSGLRRDRQAVGEGARVV